MTVPDGAPKHIEWGDRMAQALQVAIGYVGLLRKNMEEGGIKLGYLPSLEKALADLDKVRDEIAKSENLEEELHDLIQSIYAWEGTEMEPPMLIEHAQSAQRVLDRIVHVGDN